MNVDLLRYLITPLLCPLLLVMVFLLIGLCYFLLTGNKKKSVNIIACSLLFLFILSLPKIADIISRPLTSRYPAFIVNENVVSNETWVVVLCAGRFKSDKELPITSRISEIWLHRFAEGIRIHHEIPNSKILVSMGAVPPAEAQVVLSDLSKLMNISNETLIPLIGARNTKDEAELLASVVNDKPYVLVTSAIHMPRSVVLCKQVKTNPYPAPAGVPSNIKPTMLSPHAFIPQSDSLVLIAAALHEYVGLLWIKLIN